MNEQEELEKCCPLCGGKMSDILDDLEILERIADPCRTDFNGAQTKYYNDTVFKRVSKVLKIKLKMIEMGLIPK